MKKILVVEDDNFLANAYSIKLNTSGFEVKIARDGDETAKILLDYLPDIILLDLLLPKKDGFTILQELKKDKKFQDIPVIVVSNLGQKEDIEEATRLGAVKYIVKTEYGLEEIIGIIKEFINKQGGGKPSE